MAVVGTDGLLHPGAGVVQCFLVEIQQVEMRLVSQRGLFDKISRLPGRATRDAEDLRLATLPRDAAGLAQELVADDGVEPAAATGFVVHLVPALPGPGEGFLQDVLAACFQAAPRSADAQRRLGDALSCYNTGKYGPGYANGYVRRVWYATPSSAKAAMAVVPTDKVPPQLLEKKS